LFFLNSLPIFANLRLLGSGLKPAG
jgi:hypothetical protein